MKTTIINKVIYDEKNEGFFVYTIDSEFEEGDVIKCNECNIPRAMFIVCTKPIKDGISYKYFIKTPTVESTKFIIDSDCLRSGSFLIKVGTTVLRYTLL